MSRAKEPQGSQERWLNQNLFVYNATLGFQGTGAGSLGAGPLGALLKGKEGANFNA